jgi:hypothetical protein
MGKQLVNFITCGCESSAPFFVIYKTGVYNGWIGKDVGEGVLYRDIPAKKNIPTETVHGKYLYCDSKTADLCLQSL